MKKTLMLLLLLAAVSGCAPWVLVDGKYRMDSQSFEANLPTGWRRANFVQDSLDFPRFPGHPEKLQGILKQGVTHG